MEAQTRTYDQLCPVAVSLDLIGDRWTALILRDLLWRGPHGYQELLNANPGLSPTLLAERLQALAGEALVERIEVRDARRAAVYRLTEQGRSIQPVIDALYGFGVAMLATTSLTMAKVRYALGLAVRNLGAAIYDVPVGAVRVEIDDLIATVVTQPGRADLIETADDFDAAIAMDQATFISTIGGTEPAAHSITVTGDEVAARTTIDLLLRSAG